MLEYQEFKDSLLTANCIIDLIQRTMDEIKTSKSYDKDFIDFLCKLIQFIPKERLSFEEIYRNKWLNRNWNQLLEVIQANQEDELKMIEELNNADFLFEKKKYINEKSKLIDEIKIK